MPTKQVPNKKIFKSGFTLVELLVVLTIISIATGILVSVINPKKQREKALDAVIKSNVTKIVLATEAYKSATANYPSDINVLIGELINAKTVAANTLVLNGLALPPTCSNAYNGVGTNDCNIYYSSNHFAAGKPLISVKLHNENYFCWDPLSATTGGKTVENSLFDCTGTIY